MIIYRYLSRQLFWATLAVSFVLSFIIVFSRFLKYLSDAAVGKFDGTAVLLITAYRLPGLLEMILPLGLFLGVLLAYGRMYLENEMVVLQACGVSQNRLVQLSMMPAFCMAAVIGFFAFYLGPWGAQEAFRVMVEQERRSGLEVLSPRRFHSSNEGRTVTYAEEINSEKAEMKGLFIVNYDRENRSEAYRKVVLIRAKRGEYRVDDDGNRYMVMKDGERFEVDPGESDFSRLHYEEYSLKLKEKLVTRRVLGSDDRFTGELLQEGTDEAWVELQWRLSLVLLVPIITLMAVPLSRVNPRQGRYFKMLPAILLYLAYLASLMAVKGAVEKGRIDAGIGILWVHVPYLLVAVGLNLWPYLQLWRTKRHMDRGGALA
jgi:lipopolysaccharide export system permease protein